MYMKKNMEKMFQTNQLLQKLSLPCSVALVDLR
jgi:hypothetical protein